MPLIFHACKRTAPTYYSHLMSQSLVVQAPAKLNLALSVGPLNADAMHPVSSWMVTVDLFDDLYIERLAPDSFSLFATIWHRDALRQSEIDWSISKDLTHRAHDRLEQFVGRKLPIKARVEKRIPVGGGLGGGSSNAAAMLRGLNQLFDLRVAHDDLRVIAATIGSDVPFLVDGGSALVGGTGNEIQSLGDPPPLHGVLFFPNAACPTGKVYQQFDRTSVGADVRASAVRKLAEQQRVGPNDPFNDLADAARIIAPAMADDMDEIGELTALPVHVCGSGSSLFVLCDDAMHANAIAAHCTAKLAINGSAICTVKTPAARMASAKV